MYIYIMINDINVGIRTIDKFQIFLCGVFMFLPSQDLLGPWRYLVLREQLRRHRVPGLCIRSTVISRLKGWNFKGVHRHQMIWSLTISDVIGLWGYRLIRCHWIIWIIWVDVSSDDPSWYSWAHGQAWLVVDSGTGPSTGYVEFTVHRPE